MDRTTARSPPSTRRLGHCSIWRARQRGRRRSSSLATTARHSVITASRDPAGGSKRSAVADTHPAANVDIVPTVLDLLGLPVPADLPCRSQRTAASRGGLDARASYFEATSPMLDYGFAPLRYPGGTREVHQHRHGAPRQAFRGTAAFNRSLQVDPERRTRTSARFLSGGAAARRRVAKSNAPRAGTPRQHRHMRASQQWRSPAATAAPPSRAGSARSNWIPPTGTPCTIQARSWRRTAASRKRNPTSNDSSARRRPHGIRRISARSRARSRPSAAEM